MHESIYRQQQTVKRMFGPAAELAGELGTPGRIGSVRIVLDGREIGVGTNFQAALNDARSQLARSPGALTVRS